MARKYKFHELSRLMSTGRWWERHFLWEPALIEGKMHWLVWVERRFVEEVYCDCCERFRKVYEYRTQEMIDRRYEEGL